MYALFTTSQLAQSMGGGTHFLPTIFGVIPVMPTLRELEPHPKANGKCVPSLCPMYSDTSFFLLSVYCLDASAGDSQGGTPNMRGYSSTCQPYSSTYTCERRHQTLHCAQTFTQILFP